MMKRRNVMGFGDKIKAERNREKNRAVHQVIESRYYSTKDTREASNHTAKTAEIDGSVIALSPAERARIDVTVTLIHQVQQRITQLFATIENAKLASDEAYCSPRGGADDECRMHFTTVDSTIALFKAACDDFTAAYTQTKNLLAAFGAERIEAARVAAEEERRAAEEQAARIERERVAAEQQRRDAERAQALTPEAQREALLRQFADLQAQAQALGMSLPTGESNFLSRVFQP